ncbi:MAG: electron transfer flavoprotein-ubiquinone oxidoreductase [Acidobacteria bacterium]|nr:electron transfer flavoprotein-ubiquinone oxidoreductase [Acidobacteriota bacterium]
MTERDTLDVDVLFVGAGPASLCGAIRLAGLIEQHHQPAGRLGPRLDASIAIIEKGREVGSHILSGAVFDPRALEELIPDFREAGAPLGAEVVEDHLWYLTEHSKIPSPIIPPPLRNTGKYALSLGRLTQWLASRAASMGVDVFPEFPGVELLFEEGTSSTGKVIGVRTGDKGVDRNGARKGNYEPGVDIQARVVVLGEGVRGSLTKQLRARLGLDHDRNPQVYALGIKELWEIPPGRLRPGTVIHTLGFPLDHTTYGGGWVYGLLDNQVSTGLVVGLDYHDPAFDPHHAFQRMKTHPAIAGLLEGGKLIRYGAKALPEGGYYSLLKPFADGVLIIGDSAGFLNSQRLKGIHLAMKSGMLAAETIFDALRTGDFSSATLQSFEERIRSSWIHTELYSVRNFHQSFDHGLIPAMLQAGIQMVTGGRGLEDHLPSKPGHLRMHKLSEGDHQRESRQPGMRFDGRLTFDKPTDVYHSRTVHEEDQPCHLQIADLAVCHQRCTVEYGNPCQHFCPAGVYEMVDPGDGSKRLQINASNCVHCKTCDIMDPYQIINWVPPEGGGGPDYQNL